MSDASSPVGLLPTVAPQSRSIEWYHEGQSRVFEARGVQIEVRLIDRKGRRARIAIVATTGGGDSERTCLIDFEPVVGRAG